MFQTTFSRRAKKDLKEIWDYCAATFDESVADATITRIVDRTRSLLGNFPTAGMQRPEFHKNARSFAEPPNTILYMVTKKGTHVRRILHGKRNITPETISFLIAA